VAYWTHDARNDGIAAMVKAVQQQDVPRLWECGLMPAIEGHLESKSHLRVAVLVESPQHGRELLRRLPGWKLTDAVPVKGTATQGRFDPFPEWPCDQTIITHVAAANMEQDEEIDVDILVRADGSEHPLGTTKFPPRRVDGQQVLLIDVADDFDDEARAATRRRLSHYVERGWPSGPLPGWLRDRP
jgi:hypothetical protein